VAADIMGAEPAPAYIKAELISGANSEKLTIRIPFTLDGD
jgi:hypothetical protein